MGNYFFNDESINIARGLYKGVTHVTKFGRNPDIGGAPETIWMHGGIYTYLTTASTLFIHSAVTSDSAAGTGARTVTIQGLDANFNFIEETVTVNSDVATTASFLRVYRAFIATAGSSTTNEGTLIISTLVNGGGTVLADIGVIGLGTTYGLGQSQLGIYTIPAGKTGYLTQWNIGIGGYNDSATATLLTRELDGDAPFRSRDIMDVPGGHHTRKYTVPIALPEKTDVEVRAIASTGTNVSTTFDIILRDN